MVIKKRIYKREECIVFRKTNEIFGGLSNMAPGFPIEINGNQIRTSEALYQACRFPHLPKLQRTIIEQRSPMTAKMKIKSYLGESRPDWEIIRAKIMRWCLRVKCANNLKKFGALLFATEKRPIVEESQKDEYWGAKTVGNDMLVGANVLGRLLMELREELKIRGDEMKYVEPLDITQFLLFGEPIGVIDVNSKSHIVEYDLFV